MNCTQIETKNESYFASYMPESVRRDPTLVKLGLLDKKNHPMSALAVGVNGNMAYLEWLYTDPEKRGRGAATELLGLVLDRMRETSLNGIETDYPADESELEVLLEEQGFFVEETRQLYSVPVVDLLYSEELEILLGEDQAAERIRPLSDPEMAEQFLTYCQRTRMSPAYIADISGDFSLIVTDGEGEITGGILVEETDTSDPAVTYIFGGGRARQMALLLRALSEKLSEADRRNGRVLFSNRQDSILDFIEKLTGEDREVYRVPGIRHAVLLF